MFLTEDDQQDRENLFRKFQCSKESENFWKSIPGSYEEKVRKSTLFAIPL